MIVFAGLVLWKIVAAKQNPDRVYIRPINGLTAIDEAVGRAAELGRSVLFNPGTEDFTNIQSLATLGILGHVAKKCGFIRPSSFIKTSANLNRFALVFVLFPLALQSRKDRARS